MRPVRLIRTAVISSPMATASSTTAAATVAQYSSGSLMPVGITQHAYLRATARTGTVPAGR